MIRPRSIRLWVTGGAAVAVFAAVVTAIGTAGAAPVPQAKPKPARLHQLNVPDAKAKPATVAGSYIVVLKNHASIASTGMAAAAAGLTAKYGGTVTHTYSSALHGYAAHMSAAQAKALAANPDVAYVQPDRSMRIVDTEANPPSWGVDRIDQPVFPLDHHYTSAPGSNVVHAYVIDSGVHISHADFGGRANYGPDFVDGDNISEDCTFPAGTGHGTHVAGTLGGTLFGVDHTVQIVSVRVIGCDGFGTDANILAGINWVTQNAIKPAVANFSIGGSPDQAIDDAIRASIASGVTYAIAAGNGDPNTGLGVDACTMSPSRVTEAIVAGATDQGDIRADFSNTGSCVAVFAPGVDIISAFWGGETEQDEAIASGTSMAAPHVAGAAALLLSAHPDLTPAQVRAAIVSGAVTGAIHEAGPNSPDKLLNTAGTTPIAATTTLLAQANNRYVTAESAGKNPLIANRLGVGGWEQFDQVDAGNGFVAFRSRANGKFVTAEAAGKLPLVANRDGIGDWEKFKVVSQGDGTFGILANANNRFVTAEAAGGQALIANRLGVGTWERFYVGPPPGVFALRALTNFLFVTAESAGKNPLIANRLGIGGWEQFEMWDQGNGTIAIRSLANGLFVTAEAAGSRPLIANRAAVGGWEKFVIGHGFDFGSDAILALANGKIVTADAAGAAPLIANRTSVHEWEQFYIVT